MDLATWPIEDLFLVSSEDSMDENNEPIYCVFSRKMDSVTFIGKDELEVLKERGIRTLAELPE